MTTDNPGLLVTLQAKPGRENDLADFLNGGLATVTREPGTVTWYAFRINENTFGIYDTFRSEAGRQAHLSGKVAAALMEVADDLLTGPPNIRQIDVLATKAKL